MMLDAKHLDRLTTVNNLATMYRYQGRFKEAEELGIQVIGVTARCLGQSLDEEHASPLDGGDVVTTLGTRLPPVERLLGRQVVPRGKDRRKRMVAQYWVKWQGWSDEYDEGVDEDEMHGDLVAA